MALINTIYVTVWVCEYFSVDLSICNSGELERTWSKHYPIYVLLNECECENVSYFYI